MPDAALTGLRVIDLTNDSGRFATKLLTEFGADVVRLTADGSPGNPMVSPEAAALGGVLDWWYDGGKRSHPLDLTTTAGQDTYRRLAQSADLIVETEAPGSLAEFDIDHADLIAENPALVQVSITPFGRTGPRAEWVTSDLVAAAMGGFLSITGFPDRPLNLWGRQAYNYAGFAAAISGLAAIRAARMNGQGHHIDLSIHETVTGSIENIFMQYFFDQELPDMPKLAQRQGALHWLRAYDLARCKTGYAMITPTPIPDHLVNWMIEAGHESAAEWQGMDVETMLGRIDDLMDCVRDFVRDYDAMDLWWEAQSRHCALGGVHDVAAVADITQFEHRGLFADASVGDVSVRMPHRMVKMTGTPVAAPRPPAASQPTDLDTLLADWGSERTEECQVHRPHGDIDASNVDGFRADLQRLADAPQLVIDLSDVPFIDSAGLGALIAGIRTNRDRGGQVVVVSDKPALTRLLHTTGFDRIVPVTETFEDALASWNALDNSGVPDERDSNGAAARPLKGLRVADFTWVLAGPFATRMLGDLGADVIRIQNEDRSTLVNRADYPYYFVWNRSKRSATLNMKHPDALVAARRIIEASDVLIENYSAGVLDAWGLDYETVREWNPRLIYVTMSGCGHDGPWKHVISYAPTVHAVCGITHLTNFADRGDAGAGLSLNDHLAGFSATTATLAAIEARDRTGVGQKIDMAQLEIGTYSIGPALIDHFANGRQAEPAGNKDGLHDHVPNEVYPTTDGFVAVSITADEQWPALAGAVGESLGDPLLATEVRRRQHRATVDAAMTAWAAGRSSEAAMLELQAVGVPAGMVQDSARLFEDDPQHRARSFWQAVDHAGFGSRHVDTFPALFDGERLSVERLAPAYLGEHNFDVWTDVAGYEFDAVAEGIGTDLFT